MPHYSEFENFSRVLKRDNPSHVQIEDISDGGVCWGSQPGHSRPSPQTMEWRDEWGVGWKDCDGEVFPVRPSVASIEDLDKAPIPDAKDSRRVCEIREIAGRLDRSSKVLCITHSYFIYEKAINILGPEEFLVSLVGSPERAGFLLDKILNFEMGFASQCLQFKPKHVNLCDDYGHQDRLAMSPQCWRQFFKPRLKRIIDFYRKAIGPDAVIGLHSCGHVMPILEDLVEIGLDILHPVQSRSNDLKELRRITSGRLTLAGAIDGQQILPFGSPADVRKEVFTKLDLLWENGGYLPMPEKTIGVSKENLDAMNQAIKDWSRQNVEKD
ncbi:MAG: hypothetical protein HZA50_10690 [Planctomycetes bacterium]|nr:hypothetical protein [Planctomycetota bacterium]